MTRLGIRRLEAQLVEAYDSTLRLIWLFEEAETDSTASSELSCLG